MRNTGLTLSFILVGLCSVTAAARPPTDAQGGDGLAAEPVLSSLSPASVPRSDRLKLHGSGFGGSQGDSRVLIGDLAAPITHWSETDITAYVPKDVAAGSNAVQVVTSVGAFQCREAATVP